MMINRTQPVSLCLVLTFLGSGAFAQEGRQPTPERQLQFELSEEPLNWAVVGWKGMDVIEPNFVAAFTIKADRDCSLLGCYRYPSKLIPRRGLGMAYGPLPLFQPITRGLVSPAQADFMAQDHAVHVLSEKGDLFISYRLYAVSERDARKMAELYIKGLDDKALSELQATHKEVAQCRQKIAEYESKIPPLQAELKQIETQLALHEEQHADAHITTEARQEYRITANKLQAEIAGFQAKLAMIRKQRKEVHEREDLRQLVTLADIERIKLKLLETEITQEVELVGVKATLDFINRVLTKAQEYDDKAIEYARRREEIKTELKIKGESGAPGLEKNLAQARKRLAELEALLADPPARMTPVTVHENKVTIHPVDLHARLDKPPLKGKTMPGRRGGFPPAGMAPPDMPAMPGMMPGMPAPRVRPGRSR